MTRQRSVSRGRIGENPWADHKTRRHNPHLTARQRRRQERCRRLHQRRRWRAFQGSIEVARQLGALVDLGYMRPSSPLGNSQDHRENHEPDHHYCPRSNQTSLTSMKHLCRSLHAEGKRREPPSPGLNFSIQPANDATRASYHRFGVYAAWPSWGADPAWTAPPHSLVAPRLPSHTESALPKSGLQHGNSVENEQRISQIIHGTAA
jgi:hypothetical protein